MSRLSRWQLARGVVALSLIVGLEAIGSARAAADLNPKAITIQLPAELKWNKGRGAKDEDCVLQIVAMGPATSTAAEEK